MNGIEFREKILEQMQAYLTGKITKEEYYDISELFYTEYANSYSNSRFHQVFLDTVADACLIYIDEPGLTPYKKEELFYETVKDAYAQLVQIK